MMIFKYFFFLSIILSFVACGQEKSPLINIIIDRNHVANHNDVKQNFDSVHWMNPKDFTPISFLNAVVNENGKNSSINVITMLDEFPIDWVKQSDIDTLVTLIKSTKQCKCFLNPYSSYIPINKSADIGGYAIIFINSFRQKTKISLGLYSCPETDNQSAIEITKWWINYKQTK